MRIFLGFFKIRFFQLCIRGTMNQISSKILTNSNWFYQYSIFKLVLFGQLLVNFKLVLFGQLLENCWKSQKLVKNNVFSPIRWFGGLHQSFGRTDSAEIGRRFGRSFGFGRTLQHTEENYYITAFTKMNDIFYLRQFAEISTKLKS